MSINSVNFSPVPKATQRTANEAKYASEQSFDNTPKETDGKKLTTALKCLGVAAAAGLAVYAGVKGVKYLKNKNAVSQIKGLLGSSSTTATSAVSTFKGMNATQIAEQYRKGDKTIFRELAKAMHPDKNGGKSTAYIDLFKTVKDLIRA